VVELFKKGLGKEGIKLFRGQLDTAHARNKCFQQCPNPQQQ